jgi:hypothetical protein
MQHLPRLANLWTPQMPPKRAQLHHPPRSPPPFRSAHSPQSHNFPEQPRAVFSSWGQPWPIMMQRQHRADTTLGARFSTPGPGHSPPQQPLSKATPRPSPRHSSFRPYPRVQAHPNCMVVHRDAILGVARASSSWGQCPKILTKPWHGPQQLRTAPLVYYAT